MNYLNKMETRFVTILLLLAFAVVAYLSEGVSSAPADEQTAASTEAKLSVVAKLRLRICLKGLVEKTKEAHDGTKRLMNAEAYDRLREARSHYEDEQQFVGTKPEPVDRGEGLRNMINNLVLNHAAKCFSDVGKDIKDKVAIQYLVQKFDLFGDLMEIYYGCEHGEKTKEFLLESGLFETILPESRLSKLKKDFDVREQCFKAVAAAHSAAHDELKRLVDDTVKSRLKEARELYADPKTSNNEPKPAPLEGCKAIQELASKALKAGDECMYKKDVVGWNRAAAWYHMTKRFDDRGLDLTELDTACEWGERSAAEFKAAGTLDIIANPKRHSAF